MSEGPRRLSVELLDEFAGRLARIGAPAVGAVRPGLHEDAMQSLVSPLGMALPVEARVWWGWHDGVARDARPSAGMIGRDWGWLPLAEAVTQCALFRMMAAGEEEDPLPVEERWGPGWLPLTDGQGMVVIDTAVRDDAPCPVRIFWPDEPDAPPDLRSLGELVSLWSEAIDRGVWSYDRAAQHWVIDQAQRNDWPDARRGAA